jgi:hypothetical protein
MSNSLGSLIVFVENPKMLRRYATFRVIKCKFKANYQRTLVFPINNRKIGYEELFLSLSGYEFS